jgi:hypothetical protein
MKKFQKLLVLGIVGLLMLLFDVMPLQLVPDAYAIAGVRRRTARRTAVVVGSASASQSAQQQQQAAAPPPEAAPAPAPAPAPAAAPAPTPAPAPAAGALPIGTIVQALPAGCPAEAVAGVQYYHCGGNYYRAAFQGSQLIYVTTQP